MFGEDLKKRRIGDIGEQFVHEFHGSSSERVEDWYDSTRDLTINGLKAEVKTMTLITKHDEFWIGINQETKIKSVDLLFIVQIPMYNRAVDVYICPNNKLLRPVKRQRHNEYVDVLAIPMSRLYKVFTVKNDPRVDEMIALSDELSPFRRARNDFKERL